MTENNATMMALATGFDLLKKVEWSLIGSHYSSVPQCQFCRGEQHIGHKPDCELEAYFKWLSGETID